MPSAFSFGGSPDATSNSGNNGNNGVPPEVERALAVVKRILEQNKNPCAAADLDHQYDDKFALVEFITNTGIAAVLNVLEQLEGFNGEVLKQVLVVVKEQKRSMTLRLNVEEDCEFIEETTRQVESATTHQVSVSSPDAAEGPTTYSHKTVTEIQEFHWKAAIRHTLILFAGTDPSMGIVLGTRTGTTRLVTTAKKHPYPKNTRPPVDLSLTFLISQLNQQSLVASFKIDREQAKTPRRNKQTYQALYFVHNLISWSAQCLHYFQNVVWQELLGGKTECYAEWLSKIHTKDVFAPVAPLFMGGSAGAEAGANQTQTEQVGLVALSAPPAGSPLIPLQDTAKFLQEQSRSLKEALASLLGKFPDPADGAQLVTGCEAKLVLLFLHLQDIAQQWSVGTEYVEAMLYNQMETAIGKQVKASDFAEFLRFHNQRLLGKNFSARPFCYAIRQANGFPDGTVSILRQAPIPGFQFGGFYTASKRDAETIETFCSRIPEDMIVAPMSIPLNAATTVEFIGDQLLHGWVDTQFRGEQQAQHSIFARARQFSCFLMLVGNISGPNEFTPKDAILLQNKDEILIPLLTTALPSAKEFRDAIQSLSPEQARFAKSFRAMQLDSSVFGICVIQVKPQMEVLLKLPENSLTKEIQLTTDLLSLFAEYQVPPTLLSYDGMDTASVAEKVAAVKGHVRGVLDVIKGIKEEQLQEEAKRAAMHKQELEQNRQSAEPAFGSSFFAPAPAPAPVPVCLFGASPAAGGLFGASPAPAAFFGSSPAPGCLFGAPAPASSDLFGARPAPAAPFPPMSTKAPTPFGAAPSPAHFGAFGAPAPAGGGCFGAPTPEFSVTPAVQAQHKAELHAAAAVQIPQTEPADCADSVDLGGSEGFEDLEDQFSDLDIQRDNGDIKGWMPLVDFTTIPKKLDRVFESFDKDGALRTMTLNTRDSWFRLRQENLLTHMKQTVLQPDDKKTETNKALDLLDALSRSGSLPIASGELHVIVGVRHSFEQNVMATVIEENVNPIEKVDYTSLLIGSTVHQVDIPTLLANAKEPPTLVLNSRHFPPLMLGNSGAAHAAEGHQHADDCK